MTAVLWLLLIMPIGSWIASLILVRAATSGPHIPLLTAVAGGSVTCAIGGTLLAPLAAARLLNWPVEPPISIILLVAAVLVFSLPGPGFVILYLSGWFDRHGGS